MPSLSSPQWTRSPPSYHSVDNDIRSNSKSYSDPDSTYQFLLKKLLLVCAIILLGTFAYIHHLHDLQNTNRPDVRERMRSEWEQERTKWEREVKEHEDQERRTRARWDREVKEHEEQQRRARASLFWYELSPKEECIRYDSRMYSARLMNVQKGQDGMKLCSDMEITIHGQTYPRPDFCEDQSGKIYGHWTVVGNEPSCKPIFESFRDKGCIVRGSHRRRIEAFMGNFPNEDHDNWREMCSSTPADLYGHHYDGPENCSDRGRDGIWGIWGVEDSGC